MSEKNDLEGFLERLNCEEVTSFYASSSFFESGEYQHFLSLQKTMKAAIKHYHQIYQSPADTTRLKRSITNCHNIKSLLGALGDFLKQADSHTHHPLVACFVKKLYELCSPELVSFLTQIIRAQVKENGREQWKNFAFQKRRFSRQYIEELENLTHILKMFSLLNMQEVDEYLVVSFGDGVSP